MNAARLHAWHGEHSGQPFTTTDYRELIARPDVDAIAVTSPDFCHEEHAVAALQAGKHVFCEKSMGITNAAGRLLIAKMIKPTNVAAQPLDLCDDRRASFWLQTLPHERRLTVINWHDEAVERVSAFANLFDYAPPSITDLWNERELPVHNGELALQLEPHASAVLIWNN